ncbi:hypothetical protein UlMin_029219 [Ulmus minor]
MSIITGGDGGGSFSSGNNSTAREEELVLENFNGSNYSLSSTTTISNGSTTQKHQNDDLLPPLKRKRNPPGNPDPSAEVIALSPNSLLARNRFVCEICQKGFQRDQNLQLHRRGHNLPWKLRQRSSTEIIRKRVYICPEPSCVHHNPARALGDLTGIKKHFCRKHGEKKWKCEKCSKKYAVQSDWKAHSKTCGTREYKCECGTIFSRRDSFITHRAFCDAIAEENNKARQLEAPLISNNNQMISPPSTGKSEFKNGETHQNPSSSSNLSQNMAGSMFSPVSLNPTKSSPLPTNLFEETARHFGASGQFLSATALLQKAAQMGATVSSGSAMSPSQMAAPASSFGLDYEGYANQFLMIKKDSQENNNPSQIFGDEINNNNSDGMFGGLFDQNNMFLMKNRESSLDGRDGNVVVNGDDVMTVDFLGIGRGGRGISFHDQKQQELRFGGVGVQNLQGLNQFEQAAAAAAGLMGKPMWDV